MAGDSRWRFFCDVPSRKGTRARETATPHKISRLNVVDRGCVPRRPLRGVPLGVPLLPLLPLGAPGVLEVHCGGEQLVRHGDHQGLFG